MGVLILRIAYEKRNKAKEQKEAAVYELACKLKEEAQSEHKAVNLSDVKFTEKKD